MATRKGINISGTYVVHQTFYAFFIYQVCTLYSEKLKVGHNRILYQVLF